MFTIREAQINMRFQPTPVKMAKIDNNNNENKIENADMIQGNETA